MTRALTVRLQGGPVSSLTLHFQWARAGGNGLAVTSGLMAEFHR